MGTREHLIRNRKLMPTFVNSGKIQKPEPDKMHMVENDMNTTKYKEQAGNSAGNPLSAIPITTSISDSSNDKTLKKTMTNRAKTY